MGGFSDIFLFLKEFLKKEPDQRIQLRKTNKVGKFEVKKVKNKGAVSKNVVRVAPLNRSLGYLSTLTLSFLRKWALGARTNRFPLVYQKSSNGKWLKTAFEKNAHVPVFRAEMLVTPCVLSSSRHLVTPLISIHFLRLTQALCRSLVVEGRVVRS